VVTKAGLTIYFYFQKILHRDSKQACYIWPGPWSYYRTTGL